MKYILISIFLIMSTLSSAQSIGFGLFKTESVYKTEKNRIYPFPMLSLEFKEKYYINGLEAGAKYRLNDSTEVSGSVSYNLIGVDNKDLSGEYKYIDDRDAQLEFGVNINKALKKVNYSLKLRRDISNKSNGFYGSLGASRAFKFKKKFSLIPSIGFTWYDDRYMNYYYGVSDEESGRTSLNYEKPHNAMSTNISVRGIYAYSRKMMFSVMTGVEFLGKEFDTQLVDSNDQYILGAMVMYNW